MKKVLTILAIMFILLSISVISNAAMEITEEKLEASFNKIVESLGISEETNSYLLDKENDKILMSEDGVTHEVKYNLEDKPKFYIDMKFEKSMTEEQAREEHQKPGLTGDGFIFISDIIGIDIEDSAIYFLSKYMQIIEYKNNKNIEYVNGIEYAKTFYPDEINFLINDEMFTMTVNKKQETDVEYILTAELTVNIDEDFSKLNGYSEQGGEEILESFGEAFGNMWDEFNSKNDDEKSEGTPVLEENIITNNIEKNNVVANIQKIPQTGNEISIENILYSVIAIATLLGVCLTIYNKKH